MTSATGAHGFADPKSWAPLTAWVMLTAAFALYVLRKKTWPLINLRVLRTRSLASAASVLFLSGLSVYGPLLLLALYFQQVRGRSVILTGLILAAQGLGSLLPRGIAGRLTDRLGARPIALVGLLLTALGTLPFVWAGTETSEWLLGAALFIRGAGLAPVTIAVQTGAFAAAPHELVPDASSITRIVQQIGGSLSAAVLVLILAAQVTAHATQPDGLAIAYNTAFAWSIGFVLLALVPALFLPGRRAAAITSDR